MDKIIILLLLVFFQLTLSAQNSIENVVKEVEMNNSSLAALRKSVEAQKIGNRTAIFLQNPEVAFNYLWGNPSLIGNRTDLSISQTFDFPSAYGFKNQIAELKNEQSELDYRRQLMNIQLKTRLTCFDLIYANAWQDELTRRVAQCRTIAITYQLLFEKGESNILDYNKAQLNLLNVGKELEAVEIERNALLSELMLLNGGKPVALKDTSFQMPEIPQDFDQWYLSVEQNNPTFGWLKKEIEISQKQTGLNRALSLPKIQTGYMSESVVGQQFQGITVGLTIPLFENKNKVKYAEASQQAMEGIASDNKIQFYHQLKALHTKTIALQKNIRDYRSSLLSYDSTVLIKKALDKGDISLINYILEFSLYYESIGKLLQLERDMHKTMAALNQYN